MVVRPAPPGKELIHEPSSDIQGIPCTCVETGSTRVLGSSPTHTRHANIAVVELWGQNGIFAPQEGGRRDLES